MKKIGIIAGAVLVLMACNNSEQQGSDTNVSDTASHKAHDNEARADGTDNHNDSARLSGPTMMDLMEKNMDQMEDLRSLGSNDKDFASLMKIHHTGAVEMAQLQLRQGTDEQVKAMAQKMIAAQEQEIRELDAVLASSNQNSAATDKKSPFYEQVMKEMDDMDSGKHSGTIDQQFVQMMIPHHQGAISMVDHYLKAGAQDQKLKAMASRMKTDQQKEILQLKAWLAAHK